MVEIQFVVVILILYSQQLPWPRNRSKPIKCSNGGIETRQIGDKWNTVQNSKEGEDAKRWVRECGDWGGPVKSVPRRPGVKNSGLRETRQSAYLRSRRSKLCEEVRVFARTRFELGDDGANRQE